MNNDKLVLLDGTEIILESSLGMGALNVVVESIDAASALWEDFSKENLKQVTVKNGDGLTVGNYQDMVKDHMQVKENKDSTLLVTISLHAKTEMERLEERVTAVEAGQVAQDAGIDELAEVVSNIMEGGEQ